MKSLSFSGQHLIVPWHDRVLSAMSIKILYSSVVLTVNNNTGNGKIWKYRYVFTSSCTSHHQSTFNDRALCNLPLDGTVCTFSLLKFSVYLLTYKSNQCIFNYMDRGILAWMALVSLGRANRSWCAGMGACILVRSIWGTLIQFWSGLFRSRLVVCGDHIHGVDCSTGS